MWDHIFTLEPSLKAVSRARGAFYGWWLVGFSAILLTLMALTIFQGLGTFLVALERQFGWSRTALSGAFSLARVQGAVIGPVEGFLIDRFGNRRMILVGYAVMGLGFLSLSGIPHVGPLSNAPEIWPLTGVQAIWQFYVSFIIITLGSGIGGWLAIIAMVNNWFVRRRSIAMAIAMSGVHFGGLLVPALALGIESYGFRMTTFGIGVILLATLLPVSKLIRNRPEEHGLLPDGDPPRKAPEAAGKGPAAAIDDEPDFTPKEALRTPAFWILTIVHLSSTVSIVTLALHLVPKIVDMDESPVTAGMVVLTYTLIALPTQFVAGYLADRLPKPPLIFVFLMLQAMSLVVIALATELRMAFVFAVLYGIGFGGRIPLLTVIRGDYFGRKAFATIMGLSQFPNNIAMIGAPLFAGYMFDTTGSYFIPFVSFSVLSFLGAILVLFVRRPKSLGSVQATAAR